MGEYDFLPLRAAGCLSKEMFMVIALSWYSPPKQSKSALENPLVL